MATLTPAVYLAGAMTLTTDRGSTWRDEVTHLIGDRLRVLNPCLLEAATMTPDEVVKADYAMILNSAVVLAEVSEPSWGTAMEIAFAMRHNVPVIGWGSPVRVSPWLRRHTVIICSDLMVSLENVLMTARKGKW